MVDKVKERLHKQGIQQWQARKEASGSLSLYSKVKNTCGGGRKKFILSWG